jgi:uncharacterized protein
MSIACNGRHGRRATTLAALGLALATTTLPAAPAAFASPAAPAGPAFGGGRACPPAAAALGFSDALDKVVRGGATLGGLSSLAFDPRAGAWASTVDNHGPDPERIWFFRDLAHPTVVRDPLVLKRPDGTPYDGTTADDEGLVVLPDGNYVVSSETEPSIRIFGRDGVQRASLPVPARFAVAPTGEATPNATLEGLTITPDGREIVAAMEGALSGDVSASGDATAHRFLVYRADRHGHWLLTRQVAYRTETGNRIPEIRAYAGSSLLVEEASFAPATGNRVSLYAVTGLDRAPDVSGIANLSAAPGTAARKTLVADLVACPTLGAPAKEPQANPLLDNFEGMAVTFRAGHLTGISLIVDDNFSPAETTRVLNLVTHLP